MSKTKKKFIGVSYGNSMYPLITAGDKLFVSQPENISLGDIVVFFVGKKLISHRVIRIKKSLYLTKGDNVPFVDVYLSKNEIVGKVVEIKGNDYTINLISSTAKILQLYYFTRSLLLFYAPIVVYKLLSHLFIGRNIIKKILMK